MAADRFNEAGSRLLTPEAFQFVLSNELKRAARNPTFLTLVVMQTRLGDEPSIERDDRDCDRLTHELANVVSEDVRETDLISCSDISVLSLVLLDADFDHSKGVIDRLMNRIDHYDFDVPFSMSVGAACCPTHAVDAESLRRQAMSQLLVRRRLGFDRNLPRS